MAVTINNYLRQLSSDFNNQLFNVLYGDFMLLLSISR